MKNKTFFIILLLGLPLLAIDFGYEGSIRPLLRIQSDDQSELELPFKIADVQLNASKDDFELIAVFDLETRWQDFSASELKLRECYLHWYPAFGEIKLGKQIFAWGYADQNNPTDNLSAYNYYYMFDEGVERKIASLSASAIINFANFSLESVIIGEHVPNILPYDEADFPIAPPIDPRGNIIEADTPYEFGLRLTHTLFDIDYSLSYYSGHDRLVSPVGVTKDMSDLLNSVKFGYATTQVLGFDFVVFLGEFTFRSESALFMTKNDYSPSLFDDKIYLDAQNVQYVLQVEYTTPNDIILSSQFMGHTILNAEGTQFSQEAIGNYLIKNIPFSDGDISENYTPGMGSPLNSFLEQAISLAARVTIFDDQLEVGAMAIQNLKDPGVIASINATYALNDRIEIDLYYSHFSGDKDDSENFFTKMEAFSHLGIGGVFHF